MENKKYFLKFNNKYIAKGGHTHGHPKKTLLLEEARAYVSEKAAKKAGVRFFGNNGKFEIEYKNT